MTRPLPASTALLDCVYRYYPRGVEEDPAAPSVELRRRWDAGDRAAADDGRWREVLDRVRGACPSAQVWDRTVPGLFAAWWCELYPPQASESAGATLEQFRVAGMVSHLAPVYIVYATSGHESAGPREALDANLSTAPELESVPTRLDDHPQGQAASWAHLLSKIIESVFDYPALPVEMALSPVPDVCVGNLRFGEVRLIDCLFVDRRD